MWSVARVPASYGEIADERLCRHVRVKCSSSLDQTKRAVLKAFEDQYQPSEITLFTRTYDDDPKALKTDRQIAQMLSYGPDWTDLAGTAPENVLLIVSALNDMESELLLVPAAHSVPKATLLRDIDVPAGTSGAVSAAQPMLRRLAEDDSGLFDPLPLPGHIDDWLAQYREALQNTPELLARGCVRPTAVARAIYVQPLLLDDDRAPSAIDHEWLFARLLAYLSAFFDGTPVKLLPTVHLKRASGARTVSVLGTSVSYRDHCPGDDKPQPQGQLNAGELLRAISSKKLRGTAKPGARQHFGGVLPSDGFCVLGVTLTDIYCGDDDVFTGGLASPSHRAGLLSFHRYLWMDARGQPTSGAAAITSKITSKSAAAATGRSSKATSSSSGAGSKGAVGAVRVPRGFVLARACKTAAHEVLHMYGIGHCLHRSCLMNGAGHMLEDFAAPPNCCPVDLSKLVAALGPSCQLVPRYRAMLTFCEAEDANGFGAQAGWLRRAIAKLEGSSDGGAAVSASSGAAPSAISGVAPSAIGGAASSAIVLSSDDDADDGMPLVKPKAATKTKPKAPPKAKRPPKPTAVAGGKAAASHARAGVTATAAPTKVAPSKANASPPVDPSRGKRLSDDTAPDDNVDDAAAFDAELATLRARLGEATSAMEHDVTALHRAPLDATASPRQASPAPAHNANGKRPLAPHVAREESLDSDDDVPLMSLADRVQARMEAKAAKKAGLE